MTVPERDFSRETDPSPFCDQGSCLGPWGGAVPLNGHIQSKNRKAAEPPLALLMSLRESYALTGLYSGRKIFLMDQKNALI